MAPSLLQGVTDDDSNNGGLNPVPVLYETPESDDVRLDDGRYQPLAVIGFSLRFPQDATSAEAFWKMLVEGRCAMTDYPKDRLNIDAFYHPDASRTDTISARGGHFVTQDMGAFDAPFFSITPAEASDMDPMQRGLLESTYRAFENAGLPLEKIMRSKTSVYTGCFTNDYQAFIPKDPQDLPRYSATGCSPSMLANRLSWFFDLTGNSVNLDSACSSSLTAFHLACQDLWSGESTMGVAAGCNLMFSVEAISTLSNMNFLSSDSRCYSFDHRANGYARGEGFGVVIIKTLADALKDGDTIRTVIRSTGTNQDGYTPGITQPSGTAQEQLIKETYRKAGLSMMPTRFFEAHGTGTPLGDPIEANSIGQAFKGHRSRHDPLHIGAVKSSIGHLEGASGMAGLIKTILVLEKGIIPPNANFESLNPKIDADDLHLKFGTKVLPWPCDGLRRASVNSFGFGGTNCHIILDDAYNYLRGHQLAGNHCTNEVVTRGLLLVSPSRGPLFPLTNGNLGKNVLSKPRLLVWSASDANGISRLGKVYSDFFNNLESTDVDMEKLLDNLSYTLAERRTSLPWKSFTVVKSISELEDLQSRLSKPVLSAPGQKLGFVFTGQGAQWAEMAQELNIFTVFQRSLEDAELFFRSLGSQCSLSEELKKPKSISRIDEPVISQAVCTALQVALVDLLENFGIRPSVVIGHSSGEIAAGYCMGAISRESAWRLAYFRGVLATSLSQQNHGAMLAVGLSPTQILPFFQKMTIEFGKLDVSIACYNSPTNLTLSGDKNQIETLKAALEERQVFARMLQVQVAYHSPHMALIAEQYIELIRHLEIGNKHSNSIPIMVSSVTGTIITGKELRSESYWARNLVSPVKFADALSLLCELPLAKQEALDAVCVNRLLEIGPHSALQAPIKQVLKSIGRSGSVCYDSLIIRNLPSTETAMQAVARIHCAGYPVNIGSANQTNRISGNLRVLTDLPEYPFDHSKLYWSENRLSKAFRFRKHPRLDLLGTLVPDSNPFEKRWRHTLKIQELPWMEDHQINGSVLYPAGGMLVMAIEALKQSTDNSRAITGYTIKDVFFQTSLVIPLSREGIDTTFTLLSTPRASDKTTTNSEFRLYSFANNDWVLNCRGSIQAEYQQTDLAVDGERGLLERNETYHQLHRAQSESCNEKIDPEQMYQSLSSSGLQYGSSFQCIKELSCNDHAEAVGKLSLFQWTSENGTNHPQEHTVHPASLDGILQMTFAAMSQGGVRSLPTMVPTRIYDLWVSNDQLSSSASDFITVCAKSHSMKGNPGAFAVALNCKSKNPLIIADGVEATIVANKDVSQEMSTDIKMCYSVDWKPDMSTMSPVNQLKYCLSGNDRNPDPVQFFQDLQFAVLAFITKALNSINQDKLEDMEPHYRKYFTWMELQAERFHAGTLPGSLPQWPALLQDPEYQEGLNTRLRQNSKQGETYIEVGENLVGILHGKIDPLALLFQTNLVSEYYEEISNNVGYLQPMRRYLETLVHKHPSMKILEVGAGTGGITRHMLNSLMVPKGENEFMTPLYSSYDFTDISRSFFAEAEAKFAHHGSRLNFKILNIDEDLESQGFQNGVYDMVIAASVLHVTKDLNHSIGRVRKLLKPGGKLVLVEPTKPDNLGCSFIFGLLPGWWPGGGGGRENGPLVSESKWNSICSQNGFSEAEIILTDYQHECCQETSIMIFTAISDSDTSKHHEVTPLIIANGTCPSQQAASRLLEIHFLEHGYSNCRTLSLDEARTYEKPGPVFCISLLDVDEPGLRDLSKTDFENLQELLGRDCKWLWVSRPGKSIDPPSQGIMDGLSRVLRIEDPTLVLVRLELESNEDADDIVIHHIFEIFNATLSNIGDSSFEPEYKEISGILHIKRIVEDCSLDHEISSRIVSEEVQAIEISQAPPLAIQVASPGLLDSIQLVEENSSEILGPDEIEIEVKAIGLNFIDLLTALGRLDDTTSMGTECAGIVSRIGNDEGSVFKVGDRVAVAYANTCRTYARCPAECAILLPDTLSFTDAAALPTTFGTAFHSLHEVARMRKGESVLIHSAAGGTGQSALQVAKDIGAEIFATVGSDSKKQFLMTTYGIAEDHIFSSRNTSFAESIMRRTNGRGVEVVLNSLSGEALVASWECIAPYGRFVEIGKKDIHASERLPMRPFSKNVSFSAVDMASMAKDRPWYMQKLLKSIMEKAEQGKIAPSRPLQVYALSEIEQAFRHLQSGQSMGKLVLEIDKHATVQASISTKRKALFDSSATYVIAGGLGGVGRSISRWMVDRGARNLILLSRSGPENKHSLPIKEELKCANIVTPACDIADQHSLKTCLQRYLESMPPIKGCIQAAVEMRDGIFSQMSFEDWTASLSPKVQGSWNLHTVLPENMDFFIFLSSLSGIIGRETQANYSAANTYMDTMAQYRTSLNKKAVAIDLGILEEDGLLAENQELMARVKSSGALIPIVSKEFQAILEYYCDPALEISTATQCQPLIGLQIPANLIARNLEPSPFMYLPTFRHLFQISSSEQASSSSSNQSTDISALFAKAGSLAEAGHIVARALIERLSSTTAVPVEAISDDKAMHEYGVDSLVAIEIRNWFAKKIGADVAVFDILGDMSIHAISTLAAERSTYNKGGWVGE